MEGVIGCMIWGACVECVCIERKVGIGCTREGTHYVFREVCVCMCLELGRKYKVTRNRALESGLV